MTLDLDAAASVVRENVTLYDLSRMNGSQAILQRVPSACAGVYAWFRGFPGALEALSGTTDEARGYLDEQLAKPHMPRRATRVPPYHSVDLYWNSPTSDKKRQQLEESLGRHSFVEAVANVLGLAILLQGPLYVGASKDLRQRIGQHLDGATALRARLDSAGIDIRDCRLLTVILESDDVLLGQDEYVLEELVSRLFGPQFNERVG